MQVRTQDADFETQIRRTYSTQLEAIKMYMILYLCIYRLYIKIVRSNKERKDDWK